MNQILQVTEEKNNTKIIITYRQRVKYSCVVFTHILIQPLSEGFYSIFGSGRRSSNIKRLIRINRNILTKAMKFLLPGFFLFKCPCNSPHLLCLIPFPNKPWFLHVCSVNLSKTLGKGEIACNHQFFLFPHCFLPI